MFEDKNCLVIGSGVSGVGALQALAGRCGGLALYDGGSKLTAEELREKLPSGVEARCFAGDFPEELFGWADVVIPSPGVSPELPFLRRLADSCRIVGELELGYLQERGTLVAVTGTNGKTTTVTLTGEILRAHRGRDRVIVAGNIGTPYSLEAGRTGQDTVTVAEVSSFQLETVCDFHPFVSAILNVTPDHLDRHHTMEAYVRAKERIAGNQTKEDFCVLDYDNPHTRDFGKRCPATVIYFSAGEEPEEGFFLRGDQIIRRFGGSEEALLNVRTDMRLAGRCNAKNVMTAVAMAEKLGVDRETILRTVAEFRAVKHRIEYVATKYGVDYYDDSKGTNPDAAIQAIRAMEKPTILIGGGYDKGCRFDEWIESFAGRVRWLVLIGQTREKIADCARAHGFDRIRFADTYGECLTLCSKLAREGDAVLLSPACASWGMFSDYEERGRLFQEYVHSL